MNTALRVRLAQFPQDMDVVARLCWNYRANLAGLGPIMVEILDRFYPTETYGALIASLPQKHARPKGSILLIETAKDVIGCGMIQPMNGDDAEIKRVYIEDAAQGLGAGKQLSNALIAQALADGYKRILLDTSKISTAAQGLYESLGFKKRGPYSEMPADMIEVLVFYEFEL